MKRNRVSVAIWRHYEEIIEPEMLQFNHMACKKHAYRIKI
jgi:hypothetical protein